MSKVIYSNYYKDSNENLLLLSLGRLGHQVVLKTCAIFAEKFLLLRAPVFFMSSMVKTSTKLDFLYIEGLH